MTVFNPTIEVVTFCLSGWCMLGVFLLLAFTRLGHEHQDLLSPCNGMHVYTDWTSLYSLIQKSFWGMESEPMLTPREKSPLPEKISSEEDQTHNAASSSMVGPTHYQQAIPAPLSKRQRRLLTSEVHALLPLSVLMLSVSQTSALQSTSWTCRPQVNHNHF